ncbi:MAG: YbaY family lipoprotein [Betaproteobacteria bacterium]|jgi:putative lipoprotein|nr:YbaY family lipoprotein [Rhodocyclaceae bacterium]MCE2896406.1 YbaY family lipoprotein [Betaproteobacteria bacterium]
MMGRWLAGLVACAVLGACAAPRAAPEAPAASARLSGTVVWRAAAPLAGDAVLKVWLQDLSSTVAPVDYLAETELRAPLVPPMPFTLRYDPARVVPGHRLVLLVKIIQGDRIRYTNATRFPVITAGCLADCEVALEAM